MNFETFIREWVPKNSPIQLSDLYGIKLNAEGSTVKWLCWIDAPLRARYVRYVECPKDKLPQVEGLKAGQYDVLGTQRPLHVILGAPK